MTGLRLSPVLFAAALLSAPTARAAAETRDEGQVAALRAELTALRSETEARIAALVSRVEAAEARASAAESAAEAARPAPPASSVNAFNPAISLILQGRAAAIDGGGGQRDIPGFLLGDEAGVGPDGLSLSETELDLSANADDLFYGSASIALNDENGSTSVSVEEAFLQTLALPAGFTLKAGQFLSGIGYLNSKHSHAWDFIDAPLAYEAFLDNQLSDAGLQLTWVAPIDQYVELGAEALRGDAFPAAGATNSGFGAYSLFAKTSGEIGTSHAWQVGLSYLAADPHDRESELDGSPSQFSGRSDLWILDLLWKWAPEGNYRERNLVLQSELFHRHENGDLDLDLGDPTGVVPGHYRGDQDGVYAQAVYQFMPRWRIGTRYDRLWSNNHVTGLGPDVLDGGDPSRISAMLDFSNSEFSRIRLQGNHQWGGLEGNDSIFLQYILSLGSHGAHAF